MNLSLDDVKNARARTAGLVRHTPLEPSADLGRQTGGDVFLKLESLQATGSFKVRGPSNKLPRLSPEQRKKGVVAATAGNHGIGLSHAGRVLGIPVHIHIPSAADEGKLGALRDHGAILHPARDFEAAHFAALEAAEKDGYTLVSAYSDPDIIASNGVAGLELLDDQPDLDLVIVPVGGGGLAAGISLVMKSGSRPVEVWGVEAANSPTFSTWFRTGSPGRVPLQDSIAEGLAGYIEPETLTWPLVRSGVDRMTVVTDEEMVGAMRWLVTRHHLIVEPSGAAAVALAIREGARLAGRRVALVVTGSNVAWARFLRLVEGEGPAR